MNYFALLLAVVMVAGASSCERSAGVAERAPTVDTVHLSINGMHCEGCVSAIEGTALGIDGIESCTVSLEDETAVCTVSDPAAIEKLIAAAEAMDYTITVANE